MRIAIALAALAVLPAHAQPVALMPPLAGLAFLIGTWTGGHGKVADTGGTATGVSRFEAAANGSVILRRDHTDLSGPSGKPMGGFDQIMMIYPEGGTLHAEYADGTHLIHYVSAIIVPGRSVTFLSAAAAGAPQFKLAYEQSGAALDVSFAVAPPGGAGFRPVATGTLYRNR